MSEGVPDSLALDFEDYLKEFLKPPFQIIRRYDKHTFSYRYKVILQQGITEYVFRFTIDQQTFYDKDVKELAKDITYQCLALFEELRLQQEN